MKTRTIVRTIVTLRARWTSGDPHVGMLLGSPTGHTIYRIVQVVRVRRAGDHEYRFRLVCARVPRSEVPAEAVINEWCWDRRAPRPTRPYADEPKLPPSPTEVARRVVASRKQSEAEQAARIARIGREEHTGVDLGPAIRRRVMRDRRGRLLREADATVSDRPDPEDPKRTVRRAVRADPLTALLRARSVTPREVDAAEKMRHALEQLTRSMSGGLGCAVQTSAFLRVIITSAQLDASETVREAAAVLGVKLWPPVIWVLLGGTVSSFAQYEHLRLATASERVRDGFAKLADHVLGEERMAA